MRINTALAVAWVLLCSQAAHASGWRDYDIDIGNGWMLTSPWAGEMIVCLPDADSDFSAQQHGMREQFKGYAWTDDWLLIEGSDIAGGSVFVAFERTPERPSMARQIHGPMYPAEFGAWCGTHSVVSPSWQPVRDPLLPIIVGAYAIILLGPVILGGAIAFGVSALARSDRRRREEKRLHACPPHDPG